MKSYFQIGRAAHQNYTLLPFNKTVIKFEVSPQSTEVSGFSVSGSVLASTGNRSEVTLNVQVVKRMFKI